jgi:prepilin-type N-terminal cleavage/methylation domain-containing protein
MMQSRLRSQSGFTLIELMIVVVIIGLLAMMALPRFMAVSTKSKQSEAKLILKQIYVNEQAYRQARESYFVPGNDASAANPLAFRDIIIEIGVKSRYTYTIVGDAISFTATATSSILDEDAAQDVWTIDHLGNLSCVSNDAAN